MKLIYIFVIVRSCCQEDESTSYWRTSSLKCPEDPIQPQMLSATQAIDAKKQVKISNTALNSGTRGPRPQRFLLYCEKNNCSK